MSTNQTKGRSGRTITITAPTGGVTAGNLHAILDSATNGLAGVVMKTAAAGATTQVEYGHQVEVPKKTGTGESFAQGALVYVDATTKKATASATGNSLAGWATVAAGTSDANVWVQLRH